MVCWVQQTGGCSGGVRTSGRSNESDIDASRSEQRTLPESAGHPTRWWPSASGEEMRPSLKRASSAACASCAATSQPYVGIDLHRRRIVIVQRSCEGETLSVTQVANDDVVAFAKAVTDAGEHPEVVIEACYGWYWAVDLLEELGCRVHLAHPLGNAWGNRRVKNDLRDAEDLVDLLRLGRLAEAWIAPKEVRELRELVRHRAKLVSLRTNLKLQVYSVLAKEGVAVPMTDLFGVAGRALLGSVTLAPRMRHGSSHSWT